MSSKDRAGFDPCPPCSTVERAIHFSTQERIRATDIKDFRIKREWREERKTRQTRREERTYKIEELAETRRRE